MGHSRGRNCVDVGKTVLIVYKLLQECSYLCALKLAVDAMCMEIDGRYGVDRSVSAYVSILAARQIFEEIKS